MTMDAKGSDAQARAYAMANEIVSAAIRAGEIVIGLGEGGKAITARIADALWTPPKGHAADRKIANAIATKYLTLSHYRHDDCAAEIADALAAARGQR